MERVIMETLFDTLVGTLWVGTIAVILWVWICLFIEWWNRA